MKNKIYLLTLLMIAFVSQSCEDYLTEDLVSDVSASSYYTTASGFEDAVKATYSWMKVFYGPERGFTMSVFGTDTYTNGADGGHKSFNRYDGAFDATESYVRDAWGDFFKGINQANAVINRAEGLDIAEADKTSRIAEVRFLRAYYYFILTSHYGDVHLSLEETEGIEVEANRTSVADIYNQAIIPDLEFAIANLPAAQSDFGRATKPAAEFLLGKVLLRRSYKSFAEGNDAGRAEGLFNNVINNYDFDLVDDFLDLFTIGNEQNSEIIWSVQNSKSQVDEGVDGEGHRGHLYFLMQYDNRAGMQRDITNGRPWKRFRPTVYTLGLWDRSIDTRYDKTFKHAFLANNEPTIPTWTSEEASAGHVESGLVGQPKYALGDTAIFIPGPQFDDNWSDDRIAKTRYAVYTFRNEYCPDCGPNQERIFPPLNKWIDNTRPDRQKTQGQKDFILMRLADAYLLSAEAKLQQGNTAGAAEDINVVRRRSAVPGQESAIEISGGDVDLDFMLDERGRELVGEAHRWMDLTRTNTLVDRVQRYNLQGGPNIKDYHSLRPIPQSQLDRTLGGYAQNPGYK